MIEDRRLDGMPLAVSLRHVRGAVAGERRLRSGTPAISVLTAQNDATNDAMPVPSFLSSFWVSFHGAVTSPTSHTFELHEPLPTEAI